MRPAIPDVLALFVLLIVLSGCGATLYPRLGAPDGSPIPTGDALRPDPLSPPGGAVDGRAGMTERVCRARAAPVGWVIIAYAEGGDACPANRDADNPYNVAVIERIGTRPVGSTLIVCADQAVPRGWARERAPDDAECPGARVRDDASTVALIRRVR